MSNLPKYLPSHIVLVLILFLTLNPSSYAVDLPAYTYAFAQAAAQPASPPSQIASAHTVFLTNAGEDANFPMDATASLNAVRTLLAAWGRYKLVDSPNEADLVFQLHGVAPITGVSGTDGNVYSSTSPAFELAILDARTNAHLWTVTSPVHVRGRGNTRAKWISITETNLVSRIKVLVHEPLSASETTNLTIGPRSHGVRFGLVLTGVLIGVGVGGGLLIHHLYENSLANMKASQDAFCNANHIPLSQCAGG